jgi:hypothetical protein
MEYLPRNLKKCSVLRVYTSTSRQYCRPVALLYLCYLLALCALDFLTLCIVKWRAHLIKCASTRSINNFLNHSRSASQEIPRLLRHTKIHWCVHNSPPLDFIRARRMQSKSSHTLSDSRIVAVPSHLFLELPSHITYSGVLTKL